MNVLRLYQATFLVSWVFLLPVHAQKAGSPSKYERKKHVSYSVDLVSDHFQIAYSFMDHKGQMQTFRLRYPEEQTTAMINRFGIPQSMFDRYEITPGIVQTREKVINDGLYMLKGKNLVIDLNAVVNYYASFGEPIARQIVQVLDQYGTDSRRERIEMAMKFVQDIPYGVPNEDDDDQHYGGFLTPPQVLLSGYGDCDSKSALFVCILSYLVDPVDIVFLFQPSRNHVLTAVKATPVSNQISIELDGSSYVLSETAGGRQPFGGKGLHYSGTKYSPTQVDFRGGFKPLPYGSQQNIWEGYEPLTIDSRGTPNEGLRERLKRVNEKQKIITSVGLAPKGGWVVLYGKNEYATKGIPQEAIQNLARLHEEGFELKHIAFTNDGGWIILHEGGYIASRIPDSAGQKLATLEKQGISPEFITFTNEDGWIIVHDKGCEHHDLPQSIVEELQKKKPIKSVTFTKNNGWLIVYERGYYFSRIPGSANKELPRLLRKFDDIEAAFFTGNDGYILLLGSRGYTCEF